MQTADLDLLKSLGATKLITLIRTGYRFRRYNGQNYNYTWLIDREAKNFVAKCGLADVGEQMAKDFMGDRKSVV